MILVVIFKGVLFRWNQLLLELRKHAPTLLTILQSAFIGKEEQEKECPIGMCFALILRAHYSRMSLVQKIISLILLAGHAGKQV